MRTAWPGRERVRARSDRLLCRWPLSFGFGPVLARRRWDWSTAAGWATLIARRPKLPALLQPLVSWWRVVDKWRVYGSSGTCEGRGTRVEWHKWRTIWLEDFEKKFLYHPRTKKVTASKLYITHLFSTFVISGGGGGFCSDQISSLPPNKKVVNCLPLGGIYT